MHLSRRIRKRLLAILACLFGIAVCAAYLYANSNSDNQTPYVINAARVKSSAPMLYLERNIAKLDSSETARDELRHLTEESGLELTVVLLDGKVVFGASESSILDLRTALHYDLYAAKSANETYRVAFPVIAEDSNRQVANAIFTVPKSLLVVKTTQHRSSIIWLAAGALLLAAALFLFLLYRKINRDAIQPISGMKRHAGDILKGHYGQPIERAGNDEWSELYAMFDQVRLELQYLHQRRSEQDRAQKELITNISHDLRTPLTTVKAYIEAIRSGVCPDLPSVMSYMEVMQTQADSMARLIDDLLLHELKQLGQISISLAEQYSGELLAAVIQPNAHYVRMAGRTFKEPEAVPNVLIKADAARIEQVIVNLIANALKHTPPGGVIGMRIEQLRAHGREQLQLTIEDTGGGISAEDMPFIFERYYKGQTEQVSEGTGLGLSICKYIVEAHGGTIGFQSIKGQSTSFTFTIPLA
ncbi:sensor histidine kinase KdpD [Paenibacillus sp. NEAU-GSW1]|uniref:sensor histidine kinase n=1 Tax=Paenibacillus sp. NEAU-GSW1 TaxID=2682486 RepID=UPI001C12AA6F|nr:HAMP domain-containing sensor histidine kinase [Paenibacillus sp. NEAU-GSW1]